MIEVQVTARVIEAPGICSFELAHPGGELLPAFTAGAHIDLHLPGGLVRQYSLCNASGERHRYLIGVLNDPASRGGSRAVHEQLQVGSKLMISEPRNLFALVPEAGRSLLFAGGIGITPILCMAEALLAQGADFAVHYCVRSRELAAFRARLQAGPLAGHVWLHCDDEPDTRMDTAALLAHPHPGTHLYVCGPGGFMDHVLGTAHDHGWKDTCLHREYFTAAPPPAGAQASFAVKVASTGQVLEVGADESVVQALLRHGIEVPVSCEQGICGTCLTGVLEGTPEHRDLYLDEEEQARNDQFTPCCSRARSPLLVLDL